MTAPWNTKRAAAAIGEGMCPIGHGRLVGEDRDSIFVDAAGYCPQCGPAGARWESTVTGMVGFFPDRPEQPRPAPPLSD